MHLLRLDATLSGVAERVLESQAASMTSRESSLLIHMTLKWKRCLLLWVGGGGGSVVVRMQWSDVDFTS